MSAWPDNKNPSLRGAEGELVSIRIAVEPRLLERLLDVLAGLGFPINPQLTHHAAVTMVEFPAWASRVCEIEGALVRSGFDGACLSVTGMLAAIHRPVGFEAETRKLAKVYRSA
jgi:hypothetical protein